MPEHPSIEQLERRVKADPNSIAFAALAEEYRRAGRFQEAIDVCRTGLTRHPAYLSARVTLGRALIEVGQLEAAKSELERVLQTAPENLAAIRGLAEIHHRRGEIPKAAEHYQSALEVAEHTAAVQQAAEPQTGATSAAQAPDQVRGTPRDVAAGAAPPVQTGTPPKPQRERAVVVELERWLAAIDTLKERREPGPPDA